MRKAAMVWIGLGLGVCALVLALALLRKSPRAPIAPQVLPAREVSAPSAPAAAASAGIARAPRREMPDLGGFDQEEITVITKRTEIPNIPAVTAAASDGPSLEYEENSSPTMPFALILVSAIGHTDRGRRRKNNEDSYLVMPEQCVFAVADGMGGYEGGEIASKMATDTVEAAFRDAKFDGAPEAGKPRRGDEFVRAVKMANSAILAHARANEHLTGMGTTFVGARFTPNKQRMYVAHVGDSRCYRFREGKLERLTRDHTLGELLGIEGPQSGHLVRAVGIRDEVEVDLILDSPQPGDTYVLCSDGLPRMVPDDSIRDVLAAGAEIEDTCRALITAANERGGKDNVTAILINVLGPTELAAYRTKPA